MWNTPAVFHAKKGVERGAERLHGSTVNIDLSRVQLVLVYRHSTVFLDLRALHPAPDVHVAVLENRNGVAEAASKVDHLARELNCHCDSSRKQERGGG